MKQKLLNFTRLRSLVLLAVIAFLGAGQAWGEDLELSLNELYQNGTKVTAKTVITESGGSLTFTDENENFTLLLTRGSGNQPGFYTSSGYIRFYSKDTFKLTAAQGITITKIVVTPNGSNFSLNSLTGLDSSTKTWTGSASEVTFTGAGTNKWDKVTITYSSTGGTPTPTTYTVTYNANGGTGEMTDSNSPYDANATVTVLGNSFTRSGYTFTNWNTAANGSGTDYDEDDTFTITANTTLYAQWTENSGSGTTHTYNFAGANNFYTDTNLTTHPGTSNSNNVGTIYYDDGNTFVASGASRYFSSASSGYFMLGKKDAQLSLPTFSGYKITQVKLHSSGSCSTNVAISIVSGSNEASAAQTWSNQNKDYTYDISSDYQSSALSVNVTNAYNSQITSITLVCEASNSVATPEISGTENFYPSTEVTITCATENATIQYSTNGGNSWTNYNGAFTLTETTTVTAKATKDGMTDSEEATKTFTKVTPLANIAALTANTTADSYYVTLDDAVVTFVNGNNAYIQDNSGAVLLYKNGHGLTAGDVLNGTATVTYQLHNGNPQITDLSGITPASGTAPDPTSVAQSAWNYTFNNVLSQYFQITGATITTSNNKYYVSLGGEDIQLYESGSTLSGLDLTKTYTITGFPTLYTNNNGTTKELTIYFNPVVEVSNDPTIIASTISLTGFTYEEGNGPSSVKSFSVSGANLTANISISLGDNSNFEMCLTEDGTYTNSLTLTPNNGTVSETTVYVRMKSGLAIGDSYSGTITLTSTNATDVTINLSGSVTAPEAAHVTWDLTTNSYESSSTTQVDWTSSYATMVLTKGTSQTNANNFLGNSSNDHTRFYKDQVLTFTPVTGYTITEVEITAVSSYATGFVGNDWTNALASASGTKVTITPTDGTIAFSGTISAACRATEVKVYYEADNAPSISLTSTSVNADAAGDNGTIDITYANLIISDMSDFGVQFYNDQDEEISDPDWLEVLVAEQDPSIGTGYVVSYDIQANDGAARTAYFKVFALGDADYVYSELVTVTQEAYVAPTPVTAGSKWLKTDLDKLTSTNIFVIVGTDENNDSYAIPNDATDAPSAISVTVSGTTLSGDIASNLLWNISGNATDGYTFYNGNTWLGCNTTAASSNNNNIRVGTEDRNVFELDDDNYLVTKDDYVDRYLSIYVNNSGIAQDWRGYVNTNSAVAMSFFKQIESVKLNDSYGYATFASTSPLDFTDYETADFSAWAITGISGETITFNQITTIVPAGTGMLLKGDQGAIVAISVANEDGNAVTNKLEGVTAATDISTGEYYGLKGNEFVPVSAGTVPAGKALLPASEVSSNVKSFTFVFEGADGIKTVEHVSAEQAAEIFNLAGQRMSKPQRGVNIINGKKVLVK